MIERYTVVVGRIRQELADLGQALFEQVQAELLAFVDFLDKLAQDDPIS